MLCRPCSSRSRASTRRGAHLRRTRRQRLALMRLGASPCRGWRSPSFSPACSGFSPVYFANSLAVSILGCASMSPRFAPIAIPRSSTGFGAVAVGRLGAQYFLAGRLHEIEEVVRQILGYQDHLPIPFRAILGVIPNTFLAGLSLWFIKFSERPEASYSLSLYRASAVDRGVHLERVRAVGGGDLPVALRDLVSAGHLDLRGSLGFIPGRRDVSRCVLFWNDAGSGNHAGRPGPGGGSPGSCLLGSCASSCGVGRPLRRITFPGLEPVWPWRAWRCSPRAGTL